MAKRYYRPELDALRFFAFAGVFCSHLTFETRWVQTIAKIGASGMCIFFMLSAYLITTILLRSETLRAPSAFQNSRRGASFGYGLCISWFYSEIFSSGSIG